jgi:hypothetical protein
MKAPDSTAIPLCGEHHKDWHGASGYFRGMTKVERRQWADERIVEANAAYELAGGVLK